MVQFTNPLKLALKLPSVTLFPSPRRRLQPTLGRRFELHFWWVDNEVRLLLWAIKMKILIKISIALVSIFVIYLTWQISNKTDETGKIDAVIDEREELDGNEKEIEILNEKPAEGCQGLLNYTVDAVPRETVLQWRRGNLTQQCQLISNKKRIRI